MYKYTKKLILSDLYRYGGKIDIKTFIRHFLINPGFKCTFYARSCNYLSKKQNVTFNLHSAGLHKEFEYFSDIVF